MTSDDRWVTGAAYDAYMGRWSRQVAGRFVLWLRPRPSAHWLELGCGTGALTSTICDRCEPASIVACEPSEPFLEHARSRLPDARVTFLRAGVEALPTREGGFDAVVSGLVLNFLPDPVAAVASLRERLSPGGVIAAYVWDYAEGMEFLRRFWDEAVASDPGAATLDEGRRFPLCRASVLAAVFREAGLADVGTEPLDIPTEFATFDDYWTPFLRGTGPAPSYVASLDEPSRASLKERLQRRLHPESDGSIRLQARAWAVRGFSD